MLIGPRNGIIAELTGAVYDWMADASPWEILPSAKWDFIKHDWPELWVDKIHDFVGEEHEG